MTSGSKWTRVRVEYLQDTALGYLTDRAYNEELGHAYLTSKAREELDGAKRGDLVEIVRTYRDNETHVVEARREVVSMEDRIRALEQALMNKNIPIPFASPAYKTRTNDNG